MSIDNFKNLTERPTREIYLKENFFQDIVSGLKTLELRVAFHSFSDINVGDMIIFKSGKGEAIEVEITDVRKYTSLNEVMQTEDVSKLAPGMSDEQINKISKTIFSEADIKNYGLVLFEFKKVE